LTPPFLAGAGAGGEPIVVLRNTSILLPAIPVWPLGVSTPAHSYRPNHIDADASSRELETPNQEPMKTNKLFPKLAAAVALLGGSLAAVHAQTAPAQGGAIPAQDETVELSPFVVDDSRDVGYLATNTLAGSRLNTSLRDTPASISVLTPEFLADIAAFDLREATGYAVNVEMELADSDALGSDPGNLLADDHMSYRVRGLRASTARNYFVSYDLPAETSLVERIEDSRGPNSVLFGIASPGGLLNVNTKQALTGRSFRKASFTFGSYDSWRGTLDINQRLLNGKAAVRFNAVYNQNNTYRHWQYAEQKRGHLTASYRFSAATRIRAEFERGQIDDNEPRSQTVDDQVLQWNSLGRPTFSTIPDAAARTANGLTQTSTAATAPRVTYIANNNSTLSMRGTLQTLGTNRVITDTRIADYSINVGGPGMDRTTRFNVYSAFLEHQFSKTAFLELAYNHLDIFFDRFDARPGGSNQLKGEPQRLLPTGAANPFAGNLMLESNWVHLIRRWNNDSTRLTFSKEFEAGKWGNYRLAALGEYRKAFVTSHNTTNIWVDAATGAPAFNATPENGANQVWYRTYVTERDWSSYHVPSPRQPLNNVAEPVTGRTLSTKWVILNGNLPEEHYSSDKSAMLAGQARYLAAG
jgi:outer membrane receptor protein involved in Fe transport